MKKNKESDENSSIGFFKKIWYSIDKIEKYPELSTEGLKKALKYASILIILLAIATSFLTVYRTSKEIRRIGEYIDENAPEFVYKDNVLKIDLEKPVIISNEDFEKIIIDTNAETEEKKEEYISSIEDIEDAIIVLKDKLVLKQSGVNGYVVYNYKDLIEELDIDEFDKQTLVEYLQGTKIISIYLKLFLVMLIYAFIMQLINILFYIIIVSIVGYLSSIVLKLKMRYVAIFNMAIYSITLPTLLYIIYLIVNAFVDYSINYFEVMYMLVANIYMIASLFILKSEFNKKQGEVQKVIEVEKKVKEELKKQEENEEDRDQEDKKDKNDDNDKENGNDEETPEGSNA